MTATACDPPAFVTPADLTVQVLPAGVTWDAVRVPKRIAVSTLRVLGERTGAVIEDSYGAVWYWLIEPGAAGSCELNHQVKVLGQTCYVAVPAVLRTVGPGVWWVLPPDPGVREGRSPRPALTDLHVLRIALATAASEVTGAQ